MTGSELSRLTYKTAESFANVKYVPHGFVDCAVEASAARLGFHPTPEEKAYVIERVSKALAVMFGGTVEWVPPSLVVDCEFDPTSKRGADSMQEAITSRVTRLSGAQALQVVRELNRWLNRTTGVTWAQIQCQISVLVERILQG